ncbi:hypothetical protein QBC33DRAFT_594902 [Phialemonium atrogriseum]|uniref:Glucose-methanol-choline oxidoreductase C-terminal domain-containing protein n=1 Tax=Phialemonium atrogriseum TaxID=1093897 RepID=A0AAJ0FKS1_9PEZI|nr:uncharacterized protein QBC33DRAFT_594902 [Phialemonium atrogriseum]KAK1764370.1 hypothetical protein QBC33DRAFT_594902 [Phialemonium atrogriseum]
MTWTIRDKIPTLTLCDIFCHIGAIIEQVVSVHSGLGSLNKFVFDRNAAIGVKAPDRYEEIASKYESQDLATYLPDGTHPTIVAGYKQKQRVYTAAMRSRVVSFLEYMMSGSPTYSPQNVHPVSRGTIAGNTTDPEAEVVVGYRAATNLVDVDLMVEQIMFFRRFMTAGVLAQYNATESVPGAEVQTGRAARRVDTGFYRAERNLSVPDASIMPTIVGSTTSMTVYTVAEKSADIIKTRTEV